MTKSEPWAQAVYDAITWHWQPLAAILEVAEKLVPPGRALRKYDQQIEQARGKYPEPRSDRARSNRTRTELEKIQLGQRMVIKDAWRTVRSSTRFEVSPDGKKVRLAERRTKLTEWLAWPTSDERICISHSPCGCITCEDASLTLPEVMQAINQHECPAE
jgi:hypothetical protein